MRNFEEAPYLIEISPAEQVELDPEIIPPNLPPERWGSRLRRGIGSAALGAVLSGAALVGIAAKADVASGEARYPDSETTITTVAGSEDAPADSPTYLVFGGLGQSDSENAAKQFAAAKDAAGEHAKVASIHYKNQGIDESDAEVIDNYLEENNVERVGIVGISMGTPTALELLYDVREHDAEQGKPTKWKIAEIIAYSSPADRLDPWQSDALHAAAQVGYPGGMASKYLYNLNVPRLLSGLSVEERDAQIRHAREQTFDDCSPALFMSQVKLLDSANMEKWEKFKDAFEQSSAFTYLQGENHDDTVDDDKAMEKFSRFFGNVLGLSVQELMVPDAGHADTARSAEFLMNLWIQLNSKKDDKPDTEFRDRSWEDATTRR